MTHRELEVTVTFHRPPQQVFALRCAVDASGGFDGRQRVQVSKNDCHGHINLREALLEVVPASITNNLRTAYPPDELLQYLSRLTLSAFAQQPPDVRAPDTCRIGQPIHRSSDALKRGALFG